MNLLLAFLAGLASACAFEPWSVGPAMILGLAVVMWLLLRARTMRGALGLGWAFGFGQFALGLNWIATAFTFQAAMPASLGWVAVILLSAYLAVYPAMAAGLAWRYAATPLPPAGEGNSPLGEPGEGASATARADTGSSKEIGGPHLPSAYAEATADGSLLSRGGRERDPLTLGFLFAAAWLVAEWLRGTIFTGFAWNPIGVVLLTTPFAQLSPFIGTYGLSALAVLGGTVFLLGFHPSLAARRQGAWLLLVLAGAGGVGMLRDRAVPPGSRLARIVQPNIGQENKHNPNFDKETYTRLTRLTVDTVARDLAARPRLVFWPESAIPDFLTDQPRVRRRLARLLGPRDLLMTGGIAIDRDASGEFEDVANSLFVVTPGARLAGRYDKAHLTPYGEYLPARPILSAIGLSRLVPGDLDFQPGPGPRTLALPGFGRMGVQICYEIVFSGQVVDAADRPDFLFNPSNDAWFGRWGPPQHLAQARMRAVEEGMPVLRSTPTGISAVVDARGHLLASLPWKKAGSIDTIIPRALPPTLFARFGNILSFLFATVLVGAAWFARRHARG